MTDSNPTNVPSNKTLVFDVSGLSCASCVGRVQRALDGSDLILGARVNLATQTAVVDVSDANHSSMIEELIVGAGYAASLRVEGEMTSPSPDQGGAYRSAFLWAALLAAPVFILEMGGHLFPSFHHIIGRSLGHDNSRVIQFVLTFLVLAGPGRGFFRSGIPALFKGAPEMNSLVCLGTSAAFAYSTVATFAPQWLPAGSDNVYFESAAVIVVLILLGRWLEARAKGQAGAAIMRLVNLQPAVARIEVDGVISEIATRAILPDDMLHIRPGERFPVDGALTRGTGYADESMLTGEPMPVEKGPGDTVSAGTLNGTSALVMRATRVGRDTAIARIVKLVEEAQATRLPIENLVDRIIRVFVPAVLALALSAGLAWLFFGPDPVLSHALVATVSVLIIACPCAMGLAVPVTIMVASGRGAELGILLRKGDALQRLEHIRTFCFDKTGTLTAGRPELVGLSTATGFERDTVLRLMAGAELNSEHLLAGAIMRAAQDRGIEPGLNLDMESLPGAGLRALVDGRRVLIGTEALMKSEGIDLSDLYAPARDFTGEAQSVVYVAVDKKAAAVGAIADQLRPDSYEAVKSLKSDGMRVVMITGDAKPAAMAMARLLGIEEVYAETLPGDKSAVVKTLRQDGPVAFIGDGINDAPALAQADVGIAMAGGNDVATEAGDVILANGDPMSVVTARKLSYATMRNIRQNLAWAFGYNILLIPVAMGALYPFTGQVLSPALAAGAMALSSVLVVSNALRLRRVGTGYSASGKSASRYVSARDLATEAKVGV
ncbi:heavy metal translocating P-type ATPase [Halocynthiibacter namhaensis]|uniref:heavy metal translocating P-type ATPase n=1 Tax=Halocynthiibacter namhaensis TaxID=1290553 RepID=UPI0009DEFB23|nr:heavy metal translocating P-type ATPase [Halocynthiibacter namhaensis]